MRLQIIFLCATIALVSACGSVATNPASSQPTANSGAPTNPAATAAPLPTAAPAVTAPAVETVPPVVLPPTIAPENSSGEDSMATELNTPESIAMTVMSKDDLATRLGLDANAVTVQSITEVEWNDGSLGCPKPDMAYTQAIVPGFQIVLEADGKAYNYHTDMRQQVVLCENTLFSGKIKPVR